MGPGEIAVVVVVCAVVAGIVIWLAVRKLRGKPSINSECCGCPYSKDCHGACQGANKSAERDGENKA